MLLEDQNQVVHFTVDNMPLSKCNVCTYTYYKSINEFKCLWSCPINTCIVMQVNSYDVNSYIDTKYIFSIHCFFSFKIQFETTGH